MKEISSVTAHGNSIELHGEKEHSGSEGCFVALCRVDNLIV